MMEVKVSIIVPVYNVEEYIEECFESLVNQTYNNIEIIVINDGSTDRSGYFCEKWAKKEGFVYISKQNEGLGPTRNLGTDIAQGDYILFVDPDDWLALDAVEEMVSHVDLYEEAPEVIAPVAYYEYNNQTQGLKEIWQDEILGLTPVCKEEQKRIYLLYGFVLMCAKLFRKDFLLKNDIFMPNIPYEDVGVFPEIVLNAKRIVFYGKPKYFYRADRRGSIIYNYKNRIYMSDACENFLKYFQERDMLTLHRAEIKRFVEKELYGSYEIYCEHETDKERQNTVLNKFSQTCKKYFEGRKMYWEYTFSLLGGFGSRWVVHQLGIDKCQLVCHIPFSSVIAQMTVGSTEKLNIYNENVFRIDKVRNDIRGELYCILKNDVRHTDFFFIDFLEERYDIAELDDGNYITLSEAWSDSVVEGARITQVIKAGTENHYKIWKEKCKKLTALLKEKYKYEQIILIRSRLATQYLDKNLLVEYMGADAIKKKNTIINKMEDFFLEQMDNKVHVYTYPFDVYSDKSFRMGAEPQYYADSFYRKMSVQISASLY